MTHVRKKQSWTSKFRIAFSGMLHAFKDQNSFYVHLPCAALVIGLMIFLQLDLNSYCALLICIGAVIVAELFNTSLEYLARAITNQADEQIRLALDVASGAVLVTSIFAIVVGLIVFVPELIRAFFGG